MTRERFSKAFRVWMSMTTALYRMADRPRCLRLGVGVRDLKIKKGETATVEYKAEKPGTVEFRCCVRCGLGHGRMKGKIIVKE